MTLRNPTDAQLDAAFAEHVCGWYVHAPNGCCYHKQTRFDPMAGGWPMPPFTRSADAVLPWLEGCHWSGNSSGMTGSTHGYPHFSVSLHTLSTDKLHEGDCFFGDSVAKAFPYAAVLALLRAHGVEVAFEA